MNIEIRNDTIYKHRDGFVRFVNDGLTDKLHFSRFALSDGAIPASLIGSFDNKFLADGTFPTDHSFDIVAYKKCSSQHEAIAQALNIALGTNEKVYWDWEAPEVVYITRKDAERKLAELLPNFQNGVCVSIID